MLIAAALVFGSESTPIPARDSGEIEQTTSFGAIDIALVVERNSPVEIVFLNKGEHRDFAVGTGKRIGKGGLDKICQGAVLAFRLPARTLDDGFFHTEGSLYFHRHTSIYGI